MALVEDLSVFFQSTGFAVELAWTPSAGGPERRELVIFDQETVEVLAGAQQSDEPSILYRSGELLATLASEELVAIDGVDYRVREVRKIDDGKLSIATLSEL